MGFPDRFLEDLRGALRVSDAAAKLGLKLTRAGSEFKALSPFQPEQTPSCTFNDQKEMFFDFSSGRNGNVFQLVMAVRNCTFEEAVEWCAREAAMTIPQRQPRQPSSSGGRAPADDGAPAWEPPAAAPPVKKAPDKKIVAVYDYCGPDGDLIYQVCRFEWFEKGKVRKTFSQRRPVPGRNGEMAWGLSAAEYVRGARGDWFTLTEDREHWDGPRQELDEVAHQIYRLPELREEMLQPEDERQTVIIPEGEGKVAAHLAMGNFAVCASGGARHWMPYHAEEFVGADVVIEADADKAGSEGAEKKAASLRNIARRVRVLDWATVWPAGGPKSDVKDWVKAGGTAAQYWRIVDGLPDWTPARPASKFGSFGVADIDKPGPRLRWLVKNVLTAGDVSIWYGDYGCGKSFLMMDAALAIDRGQAWFGLKVQRGLVIYQAGEGGIGYRNRFAAYIQERMRGKPWPSSIQVWPKRINLFADDKDVTEMIEEAKAWSAYFDLPHVLQVIDTTSSAIAGADENAAKDVTKVLDRCRRFASATGAHVALVHHVPKGGYSPRGSGALGGNVDTLVLVERLDDKVRDPDRKSLHDRRRWTVTKVKEGPDRWSREFYLPGVRIGADEDGDDVTSCVVKAIDVADQSAGTASAPAGTEGWSELRDGNRAILRALQAAIDKAGRAPPAGIAAPELTKCVPVGEWISALCEVRFSGDPLDPPTERYPYGKQLHGRCKKQVERTYSEYEWAGKLNLIGKSAEWVWRTDRRARGVDRPPPPRVQSALPMTSTGESVDDLIEEFK